MGKTYKKRTIKFRKTGGVGPGFGSIQDMWRRHAQEERARGTALEEMRRRQSLHERAREAAHDPRVLRETMWRRHAEEERARGTGLAEARARQNLHERARDAAAREQERARNNQKIYDFTKKKFEYERPDSVDYIYPPIKATETGVASWRGHGIPGFRPSGIKEWGADRLEQSWLSPKDWAKIWKTSKPGLGHPAIEERPNPVFAGAPPIEHLYDIRNDPNIDPDDPIKAVPPNYRVHQGWMRAQDPTIEPGAGAFPDEYIEAVATRMENDWKDNENIRKMTKILVKLWKTCQNTSLTDYERRVMYNKAKLLVDKMEREKGARETKEYLKNAPGAVIPYPLPRFEQSCGISQFTDDELVKVKRDIAFDAAEAAFRGEDPSSTVDKRIVSPHRDYLLQKDMDEGFKGINDHSVGGRCSGRYKKNRKTIKHKKKRKLRKSKKY